MCTVSVRHMQLHMDVYSRVHACVCGEARCLCVRVSLLVCVSALWLVCMCVSASPYMQGKIHFAFCP